jgi:hypothetical protein
MNDHELRQLIRESIARHSGLPSAHGAEAGSSSGTGHGDPAAAGFARFPMLRSGDETGACVIEPSVPCNHCGYCLSYGH